MCSCCAWLPPPCTVGDAQVYSPPAFGPYHLPNRGGGEQCWWEGDWRADVVYCHQDHTGPTEKCEGQNSDIACVLHMTREGFANMHALCVSIFAVFKSVFDCSACYVYFHLSWQKFRSSSWPDATSVMCVFVWVVCYSQMVAVDVTQSDLIFYLLLSGVPGCFASPWRYITTLHGTDQSQLAWAGNSLGWMWGFLLKHLKFELTDLVYSD